MIKHAVIFILKYTQGSAEEKLFFEGARKLAAIEGVKNFECLRQTSAKNKFKYGLSMEFETRAAYELYNIHPAHQSFIQDYWMKYVEDFMEIDYEPME